MRNEFEKKSLDYEVDALNARLNYLEKTAPYHKNLKGNVEMTNHFETYVKTGQLDLETKALSTSGDGGYFVPTVVENRVTEALNSVSPLRQISNITTISTDALDVLIEKKHPSVGWVSEHGDRVETDASEVEKLRICVHEMYAKPRATQKLLDDSNINIEEWMVDRVSAQMARVENAAFVNGDGKNKPKGFLTYAGTDQETWGKLQTFTTCKSGGFMDNDLGVENLFDVVHSLRPEYLRGACWVMTRSALVAIRKLKDNRTDQFVVQQQEIVDGGIQSHTTLLGFPVILSDDLPALNPSISSISVAFGNFKLGYQIVDRQGLNVLRDPFSAKPHVEFYTTRRVGGDVVDFHAIKLLKFAD